MRTYDIVLLNPKAYHLFHSTIITSIFCHLFFLIPAQSSYDRRSFLYKHYPNNSRGATYFGWFPILPDFFSIPRLWILPLDCYAINHVHPIPTVTTYAATALSISIVSTDTRDRKRFLCCTVPGLDRKNTVQTVLGYRIYQSPVSAMVSHCFPFPEWYVSALRCSLLLSFSCFRAWKFFPLSEIPESHSESPKWQVSMLPVEIVIDTDNPDNLLRNMEQSISLKKPHISILPNRNFEYPLSPCWKTSYSAYIIRGIPWKEQT